jgi:signal peptidase II
LALLKNWKDAVLFPTAALVFSLDQVSKALVAENLTRGQPWSPVPQLERVFSFTYITNSGAAFGLFPDQTILFILIAFAVIGMIVVYYRYLPMDGALMRFSLGLQLGGALGNLLDRLRMGYVIDFLDFKFWPIFNLADSAIVVGVAILACYLTFLKKERPAAS